MDNQPEQDTNKINNSEANQAAERRNKKRRPADYYKKDYPIEILTRDLQQQEIENKNEEEVDENLKKNLILNDTNNNTEDDGSVEESSSTRSNSEEDQSPKEETLVNDEVTIKNEEPPLPPPPPPLQEPLQQKLSNPWGAQKNWSTLFKGPVSSTSSSQQTSTQQIKKQVESGNRFKIKQQDKLLPNYFFCVRIKNTQVK